MIVHKNFIPRYIELLETGGADSPENLTKKMGFDIRCAEFWESGFRVIQSFLEELKALVR